MYDVNTKLYAEQLKIELSQYVKEIVSIEYLDEKLVPSEDKCEYAYKIAFAADYVLAVGSGTLNDMAESVATSLGM